MAHMTKLSIAVVLLLAGFAAGRLSAGPATVVAAQATPGNVNARFRDHTRRIFDRHDMKSVGYWTPLEGPTSGTTLIYLLEHPSREAARTNWAAFSADPEWQKVKAESEADGKIVAKAESVFLVPTDYSPMK